MRPGDVVWREYRRPIGLVVAVLVATAIAAAFFAAVNDGPACIAAIEKKWAYSCAEFWFERYQTLTAGILALITAIIAANLLWKQNSESEKINALQRFEFLRRRLLEIDRAQSTYDAVEYHLMGLNVESEDPFVIENATDDGEVPAIIKRPYFQEIDDAARVAIGFLSDDIAGIIGGARIYEKMQSLRSACEEINSIDYETNRAWSFGSVEGFTQGARDRLHAVRRAVRMIEVALLQLQITIEREHIEASGLMQAMEDRSLR
ncbi:hypothetical protein CHELA1G11_12886 [Hyphomicrobiales bacterium]|nr:hypothetical protein CHELA1G2_11424 [Hyphomicrobiales bacterium]CAH1667808.1 hypothetical protein CHELA1G11_12886 [Hyphomicrobiales bacterium]